LGSLLASIAFWFPDRHLGTYSVPYN